MKSLFVQIIFLTLSLLGVNAQKGVDTNSKYGVAYKSRRNYYINIKKSL